VTDEQDDHAREMQEDPGGQVDSREEAPDDGMAGVHPANVEGQGEPEPGVPELDMRELDMRELDMRELDVQGPNVQGSDVHGPDVQGPDVHGSEVVEPEVLQDETTAASRDVEADVEADEQQEPDRLEALPGGTGAEEEEPRGTEGEAGQDGQPGEPGREGDAAAEAGVSTTEQLHASAELKAILEALIFASPDPLTRRAIGKLLTSELAEDIDVALNELKRDYERPGGLQLVEVAGGYQIVTRSDLHEWVRRLFHERTTQKLTVQALETLAVIAYRQPVTALEVTEIRGVTAAGVLNTLLERHLIKIVGRKKVVGRPFLYATTKEFLIRFGLNEIGDLPKVEDMVEALGFEPPLLIEHAPGEDSLPLEEPESEPVPPADDEPSKIH
jgi:segregation and condensation protein B